MSGPFPRPETERARILARRMARLSRRVWGRRGVNAFLIVHITALTLWLLPYNLPVVQHAIPPGGGGWVRTYLIGTGFQQSWQMFSPNPDTRDFQIVAHITYADGQARDWPFPRMRALGYGTRYRRERMRKYIEIANYNEFLWLSLARYAARQNNANPHNPPVGVQLIRYGRDIPPPGQPPVPYKREEFYHTLVTPGDLR